MWVQQHYIILKHDPGFDKEEQQVQGRGEPSSGGKSDA